MGPSHWTTRIVLLLTGAPFQSEGIAVRTRSAPRKGSRRAGEPAHPRRPDGAGSLGPAPTPTDIGRQGTGRPEIVLHEVFIGHPEPEFRLDEEEDLQQCHRVEA